MQETKREIRVYTSRSNTSYPCIILQGKWLADLGFSAGDYLSIDGEDQKISIQIKEKFQNVEEKETKRKK